ncbi:hypothetical protein [Methanosarcina acetivorans]|uniref:hypothetical protein n=1 Tax=Methanosarcina acetivorans TaxID=2214 RepID=UPI0012FEABA7|nr:hypothetical protein [Methanosarcina acetivorans]
MTAKSMSRYAPIDATLLGKNDPGKKLIYSETGRNTGMEFVDDIVELIKGLEK